VRYRYLAYAAFFMSGTSSLIFQNIWSRMLHHVFGATSVAISSVVTVFMAGLGLGAWIGGKYADRIKHPIITYAFAELGVGLWAFLVPWLVDSEGWLSWVNQALRTSLGAESMGFMLARFACVVPILIVPTTLMGTTLPLLARHFVQSEQRAGVVASRVGALYAINTFGAVAGVLLAGFVLLPTVGLAATNIAALSINFALGFGILALRRLLLSGVWSPGEKLGWRPAPVAVEAPLAQPATADGPAESGELDATAPTEEPASATTSGETAEGSPAKTRRKGQRTKTKATAAKRTAAPEPGSRDDATEEVADEAESDLAMPIPPIARKAAYLAFAASGAAALCYEVVWTRALAMTIGSSIYSFALILATFLIGIAGGSALFAALVIRDHRRLWVLTVGCALFIALANAGWWVEKGLAVYLVLDVVFMVPVVVIAGAAWARRRAVEQGLDAVRNGPAVAMLSAPVLAAVANAVLLPGHLPKIIAAVVCVLSALVAVIVVLRRYPILMVALIQLLIAVATFANYWFQDEIPYAFARLVTTVSDLPNHVGTVQFFMFVAAGLCTLPAAVGMGAMFPLTMRIWTAGGRHVGRDVGVVYVGNTVGSIVGAWLPGFVLMPLFGMERTLHVGMVLNLVLALMMLVVSAAEPARAKGPAPSPDGPSTRGETKRAQVPIWHAVTVYVLAPLIPALIALLYMGTRYPDSFLRWNLSHMTLGVFRVSLAADVLDPDSWGEPDLVYYQDGLSTTVSVERWVRHYALKNNGKVDASNGDDMPTQIMVAAFPLLMHRQGPEGLDVAVIGFGSGVTLGTALEFPVRSVDAIELERSIPEASQFFQDVNHLEYPLEHFPFVQRDRLTVFNDDGRNYLASTDRRYDVIMSEPSNPWITGVSDLFTTDHFRITKRVLRPGGIYCQWVQLYELSPENIKTIYRSFASQFRHVVVFAAEDLSSDTVLLGSDSPLPLDLAHLRESYSTPGVAPELERAYIHSPFDLFARVLLASREEVLEYTQIEYRRRRGRWIPFPEASNGGSTECGPPDCRRDPVELNTDDNALIEFSAPHDLIGFERYEGYLANIYSPDWPYGRLTGAVVGFGEGEEAARNNSEMAMALIGHGRKTEAGEFIRRAHEIAPVRETLVAAEVLRLLLSDQHGPRVSIEPPVPGPRMEEQEARQLSEGFEAVRQSVDLGAYGTALAAMEEIPAPLRLHSGPGMRFLYAYLLYRAAEGDPNRYRSAIDHLEDLVRSDEEYVRRHPELYYFLGRAHDAEFNFDKALRNMRIFVESEVVSRDSAEDLAEPPLEDAPTTDEPGESPKDVHTDRE